MRDNPQSASDRGPVLSPLPIVDVPCALGPPLAAGQLRVTPDDFCVDEVLGFEPSGEGEHWLLQITKRGRNTMDVVDALAAATGVRVRDIGFCGMKDRHAVTTQWFSLPWPIRSDPPALAELGEGIHVAALRRHDRKLRRGAHKANHFRIRVELDTPVPAAALADRVALLERRGVPNAFGPQRFGRQGSNLGRFAGSRKPSGMALSAARSALFNAVLARRVTDGSWDQPLDGEWCMLDGSRSGFVAEAVDTTLVARCQAMDVHPSGPMPGRAGDGPQARAAALEGEVLGDFADSIDKLSRCRVDAARRPLRVRADAPTVAAHDASGVTLDFALPAGAFATSVIDQCFTVRDAQHAAPS